MCSLQMQLVVTEYVSSTVAAVPAQLFHSTFVQCYGYFAAILLCNFQPHFQAARRHPFRIFRE
jgi:hypothetical protein